MLTLLLLYLSRTMITRAKLYTLTKPFLPKRLRNWLRLTYQHVSDYVRYGDWFFFQSISLEVSVYCNRTCYYCPNTDNVTPREFMSEEVFTKALERMKEIRYAGIVDFIFYNEPLLDPRLPELARRIKEACPRALLRVTTNGDALTELLLMRLVDAGVISIYVTRHVPAKPGWDARINFLAAKYPQYVSVTDITKVLNDVGLWNRAGLVTVEKEYKVDACRVPEGSLNIDRHGNVLLCCCDYFHKNVQGNIMKESLLEIWRGEKFSLVRKELRHGHPLLEICRNCILRVKP